MNAPIDIDEHNWLYIDTEGLALVHEMRGRHGELIKTDQVVIPWPKVRHALAIHDRKKRPRGCAPTRETR